MSRELIPRARLVSVAQRFKLLSETVRLELISELYLRGESNVQELVTATGHQQANVSKHLLLMTRGGLLRRRKVGLNVYYSLFDPSITALCVLAVAGVQRHDGEL